MHRNPHYVVNEYKIQRINKLLIPLKRMMEGKAYAAFLEIPPEPVEAPEEKLIGWTAFKVSSDGDGG